jgi:uracil phosphoribosyltransferase
MSCCNKETTKTEFLIEKGKNFKKYILTYRPNSEVVEYMHQFDEKNIMSSILTLLVPMKATGSSDMAINELISKLTVPTDEIPAVKEKIGKYFDMFVDVAITTS